MRLYHSSYHHNPLRPLSQTFRREMGGYARLLADLARPHLLRKRADESVEEEVAERRLHVDPAERGEAGRVRAFLRDLVGTRGGPHSARDLIMNTNDSLTWMPRGQRWWQRSSSVTAAAAAEGDSLARPGLPRWGTQRMHHHPTAKAMGVMVPTPYDLRVACGGCAAQRSRGAAAL